MSLEALLVRTIREGTTELGADQEAAGLTPAWQFPVGLGIPPLLLLRAQTRNYSNSSFSDDEAALFLSELVHWTSTSPGQKMARPTFQQSEEKRISSYKYKFQWFEKQQEGKSTLRNYFYYSSYSPETSSSCI